MQCIIDSSMFCICDGFYFQQDKQYVNSLYVKAQYKLMDLIFGNYLPKFDADVSKTAYCCFIKIISDSSVLYIKCQFTFCYDKNNCFIESTSSICSYVDRVCMLMLLLLFDAINNFVEDIKMQFLKWNCICITQHIVLWSQNIWQYKQ